MPIINNTNPPVASVQYNATSVTLDFGPTCDYNNDGAEDFSDVLDLADAIASGGMSPIFGCKDFNQDGSEDNADVTELSDAVTMSTCQ